MKFLWIKLICTCVLSGTMAWLTIEYLNSEVRFINLETTINILTREKGDLEIRYGRLKEGCYLEGGWLID